MKQAGLLLYGVCVMKKELKDLPLLHAFQKPQPNISTSDPRERANTTLTAAITDTAPPTPATTITTTVPTTTVTIANITSGRS